MKAEMYYRETYPKELRIQLENDDEVKFFKLVFSLTPKGFLDKMTGDQLESEEITKKWVTNFIKKGDAAWAEEKTAYTTNEVYEELLHETENMKVLQKSTVK